MSSLLELERIAVGEVGVLPGSVKMVTTDNLSTVTTPGYINSRNNDVQLSQSDIIEAFINFNVSTGTGSLIFLQPSILNGIITLTLSFSPGGVTMPVVDNDFANFDGTSGQIKDGGYSPTDPLQSKVVMLVGIPPIDHIAKFADANGSIDDGGVLGTAASKNASNNTLPIVASVNSPVVITRIAKFVDTVGTIDDIAGIATNLGNISAGIDGTAGSLISYPPALSSGFLSLSAITNLAGNFSTTISNTTPTLQNQTASIPDLGATFGNFLMSSSALGTQSLSGSLELLGGSNNIKLTGGGSFYAGAATGQAGTFISYPPLANSGSLIMAAVTNASGNFTTTISNASAVGQNQLISIPNSNSAFANFIISSTLLGTQTLSGSLELVGGSNNISLTGGGSFIAGSPTGTAGNFISYPATINTGRLILAAIGSGNFDVTINNAVMSQATVYTIPNTSNALGRFLVAAGATPFVSGEFPVASGTGGLMTSSGVSATNIVTKNSVNTMAAGSSIVLAKVNGTEAANAVTASGVAGLITTSSLTTAGLASYTITWTNTFISSTSAVMLQLSGGTNTVNNITMKVIPGAGTASLIIYNNTAATALNGTILISYVVL